MQNKGKTAHFIDNLLLDAQTWSNFRALLQIHVRKAGDLRRDFEEKLFLREEVRATAVDGGTDGKPASQIATEKLSSTIKEMEEEIEVEIKKLDKKTKEMIQLVIMQWYHKRDLGRAC